MIDEAIEELTPVVGVRAACAALGGSRARHYRRHRKSPAPPRSERVRTPQPRALSEVERKEIRRVLNSAEHTDEAPATVYAKLLDEGVYLGSVSTMYRVLRQHGEVGDRRRHATHPARVKPELVAARPNQVYSWDITKLHGPVKWTYYYLYSIIDIYSRYVPGWMLARAERASLAEALMAETIEKQGIGRGELTIHSDRGSPMIAKPVAHLLADLGVTKSHGRTQSTSGVCVPALSAKIWLRCHIRVMGGVFMVRADDRRRHHDQRYTDPSGRADRTLRRDGQADVPKDVRRGA